MRILLLYGTGEGHTEKVAFYLAEVMRRSGVTVDLLNSQTFGDAHLPPDYDAYLVGSTITARQYQPELLNIVTHNRALLTSKPAAFFSVSLTGLDENNPLYHKQEALYFQQFCNLTGWRPALHRSFKGALLYSNKGWVKKLFMRWLSARLGGDTDMSRDYIYTDWNKVYSFAQHVIEYVKTYERVYAATS